jgi:hypothetical protein
VNMLLKRRRSVSEVEPPELDPVDLTSGCQAIGDVRWRDRVKIYGRVRSLRVQPWADVPTLECVLVDETGGVTVVFLGRRWIPGIQPGTRMSVEGTVGAHHGKLAMLNPEYVLQPA